MIVDSDYLSNCLSSSQSKEQIADLVGTLPFSKAPGFYWSGALQGYSDYTFGARIDQYQQFYFLCHEMAHAIEFGPNNYASSGFSGAFRFKINTFWLIDRHVTEQSTFQASLREARTAGIQARLMEMAGFTVDLEAIEQDAFGLTRYMPDWFLAKENRDLFRKHFLSSYKKFTPTVINFRMTEWLKRSERSRRRSMIA